MREFATHQAFTSVPDGVPASGWTIAKPPLASGLPQAHLIAASSLGRGSQQPMPPGMR